MEAALKLAAEGRLRDALTALDELPADQRTPTEERFSKDLAHDALIAQDALNGVDESLNWKCVREEERLTVHYKKEGTIHSVRFCGTYECDCSVILAFGREFDLMMGWNKYMPCTAVLDSPSLFQTVSYGELWLPWPYGNRRLTVAARGVDLIDEKDCVLALLSSVFDEDTDLPPSAAKCVSCTLGPQSCLKLEPVLDGSTRATMVLHIDPQMPHAMPAALMNVMFKVVSPWMHKHMQQIVQQAQDYESEYNSRIAARPELYGHVATRFRRTVPPAPREHEGEENFSPVNNNSYRPQVIAYEYGFKDAAPAEAR
eukprot:TRINITY_DN50019_c0_g1_i2.p1 TRINITY_DN50019_c0_g1~~TRINITY_DN50019_c0_g1_i2.p1  ORF type:complete len:314 (-),score=55.92 TRINITY_DN50019_c0_g1_i2:28-969(-)